jgi:hypothetical protein
MEFKVFDNGKRIPGVFRKQGLPDGEPIPQDACGKTQAITARRPDNIKTTTSQGD